MERLSSISTLVVRQRKELGEIFTGFETRNSYGITDASGNPMYLAAEEAGSTLMRLFLKALRPFTISVLTDDCQVVFRITRPFRFYFHRAEVVDAQGQPLGSIERRFSLLRRIYSVLAPSGKEISSSTAPCCIPGRSRSRKRMSRSERSQRSGAGC